MNLIPSDSLKHILTEKTGSIHNEEREKLAEKLSGHSLSGKS